VPAAENSLNNLPEDSASLKALLCAVIAERDRERRRAEEAARRAEEQEAFAQEKSALAAQQSRRIAELAQRADELYIEKLRLQMELARYRKWTYGPRADRLSEGELLQALLDFGEELERKPLDPEDVPLAGSEPACELRRVKRRAGRRTRSFTSRNCSCTCRRCSAPCPTRNYANRMALSTPGSPTSGNGRKLPDPPLWESPLLPRCLSTCTSRIAHERAARLSDTAFWWREAC